MFVDQMVVHRVGGAKLFVTEMTFPSTKSSTSFASVQCLILVVLQVKNTFFVHRDVEFCCSRIYHLKCFNGDAIKRKDLSNYVAGTSRVS